MYWDSLFNWAVVQFKVKDGSSGNLNAALYKLISQFSLSVTGTVRVLLNQCKVSQITDVRDVQEKEGEHLCGVCV